MAKLPRDAVKQYFPFYPDRWLTSRRLRVCSPAARGVLIDLMAMAWEDGGKVCEDLDVLASSMGLTPDGLQVLLDELVKRERISIMVKKGTPPVIHVPHLEAIHAEAIAYIAARQADGKRGADARYKGAHRDPIGSLQGAHRDPIGSLQGAYPLTGTDRTGTDRTIPEEKAEKPVRKTPAPRFVPPTLDEVRVYIAEKGYSFNADAFMAYYESNGWKVGRTPMRDWRAACRTWQSRQSEGGISVSRYQPRRASQAVTTDGPGSTLEGVLKIVEG